MFASFHVERVTPADWLRPTSADDTALPIPFVSARAPSLTWQMVVFALLFVMQVRVLYQVGTRTDIAVDHSDDATFQINFKLELPSLSCEWATVDVIDALGSRHFNISGEGVYKHSLGASHYLGRDEALGEGVGGQGGVAISDAWL